MYMLVKSPTWLQYVCIRVETMGNLSDPSSSQGDDNLKWTSFIYLDNPTIR
nr:hypothetical protein Q903MT_gene4972 [Picea sitchensis]